MQILIRLGLILISPYLLVVYWRNSLKTVEDLHSIQYQNQMID